MTIDEAIIHAREVASRKFDDTVHCIRCVEEHEQLAEWLEELKTYRECNVCEYNKAIDDFVKFASNMPTVETEDGTIRPMWLEEMAEKLKEKYNQQRSDGNDRK